MIIVFKQYLVSPVQVSDLFIKGWVSDVPDIANDAVSCNGRKEDTGGICWAVYSGVGC